MTLRWIFGHLRELIRKENAALHVEDTPRNVYHINLKLNIITALRSN